MLEIKAPRTHTSMAALVARSDLLSEAERLVDAMYVVHDTYFTADPAEKQARLGSLRDEVVAVLGRREEAVGGAGDNKENSSDAQPRERPRDDAETRGRVLFLRGKALDVCDAHCEEAEEALKKAVKLLPECIEAYNTLGNCFWKRGTADGMKNARECFKNALRQSENKVSLRQLSMVLRQLGDKGSDE